MTRSSSIILESSLSSKVFVGGNVKGEINNNSIIRDCTVYVGEGDNDCVNSEGMMHDGGDKSSRGINVVQNEEYCNGNACCNDENVNTIEGTTGMTTESSSDGFGNARKTCKDSSDVSKTKSEMVVCVSTDGTEVTGLTSKQVTELSEETSSPSENCIDFEISELLNTIIDAVVLSECCEKKDFCDTDLNNHTVTTTPDVLLASASQMNKATFEDSLFTSSTSSTSSGGFEPTCGSDNVHSIWSHGKRKVHPEKPCAENKCFYTSPNAVLPVTETCYSNFDQMSLKFTNIGSLMDCKVLTCWKNGILFNHPDLYFSVEEVKSSIPDRKAIETKVSNTPLGWRVIGFILDHIRTVIEEWYPGLTGSDGQEPYVLQRIACPVCISTGIKPPRYFDIITLFKDLYKSNGDTSIACIYTHCPQVMSIGDLCPELVFKDLPSSLRIHPDKLHYQDQSDHMLGFGAFGQVYRGRYDGIEAAVKEYKFSNDDCLPASLDVFFNIRQEIFILSKLQSNPFIVEFLGFCTHPKLCAVMERACHGTLRDALCDETRKIDRILMFRIAQQIASGLAFIHSRHIIHRDIKPDNVLLFSLEEDVAVNVKITDFGTALFSSPTGLNDIIGTPGFIAPEMYDFCSSDEYTSKVDVYSFAMVLCEMITNRSPFHDLSNGPRITSAVKNGERPNFSDVIMSRYGLLTMTQLTIKMWRQECTMRPEAKTVLNQLNNKPFQLLYGKRVLKTQNPRYFCYVATESELWIVCDDMKSPNLTIMDIETSEIKDIVNIDGREYGMVHFNLVHICLIDPTQLVLVLRGKYDVMLTFSVKQRKVLNTFTFDEEHVTSIYSSINFIFIGYGNGRFTRILKKNFSKKKLKSYATDIDTHLERQISAILANSDNLIVACDTTLHCYRLDFHNSERINARVKRLSSQPIEELVLSYDEEMLYVSFQCSPEIRCFRIENLDQVGTCNVEAIIWNSCPGADRTDTRVSCMCCVYDVLWVGTGSGSILIFEVLHVQSFVGGFSEINFQLVLHIDPYSMETRNLCLVELARPRLDGEKYLVVSNGRSVNPEVFGHGSLCQLDDTYPVEGDSQARRYSTDILNMDNPSKVKRNKGKYILLWQVLYASSLKNMKSY